MAFRFRLDHVLRHRGRIVDDRSRDMALAEERFRRLDDQTRELDAEWHHALAEEARPDGTPLDLGNLMAKRRWLGHLGNRRDQVSQLRTQALEARDRSRELLEEAWRQKEVLTRLKARRQEEHQARAQRNETLAMDEIASVRHAMGRPEHLAALPAGISGSPGMEDSGNQRNDGCIGL